MDPSHRAFEAILDWVLATASFGAFVPVYHGAQVTSFAPTIVDGSEQYPSVHFAGIASGKNLSIIPHETFRDVAQKANRATKIAYVEESSFTQISGHVTDAPTIIANFSNSMFVNYYEGQTDSLKDKFGNDQNAWPEVWRFARVVRNATSHNGKIYIRNSNEREVSFFNIAYSHADNGRVIMHADLASADMFFLILEMDRVL